MEKFIDGNKLSENLKKTLENASSARFAVAFWGHGAADKLGIKANPDCEYKIVCNLLSGGTNPEAIKELIKLKVDVRQLNDLHAKLGIIDDLSFLGSSNMSTNGLGDEDHNASWQEANVIFDEPKQEIIDMFEKFWGKASRISDPDLEKATKAWNIRSKANAVTNVAVQETPSTLVEILRTKKEYLDSLNVRMIVYDEVTDKEESAALEKADKVARKKYGKAFGTYSDWASIGKIENAYFIDHEWPIGKNKKIRKGHMYSRDTKTFPDLVENKKSFQVVYKVKDIEGISFGKNDKKVIIKAFNNYIEDTGDRGEYEDERAYNILLSELADYLPPE